MVKWDSWWLEYRWDIFGIVAIRSTFLGGIWVYRNKVYVYLHTCILWFSLFLLIGIAFHIGFYCLSTLLRQV